MGLHANVLCYQLQVKKVKVKKRKKSKWRQTKYKILILIVFDLLNTKMCMVCRFERFFPLWNRHPISNPHLCPLTWMYVQLSGHYIQLSGHYIQLSGHNCVHITGHMVHKKKMTYNMRSLRELYFVYIITSTIDWGIRQSQSQLLT